MEIEEVVPQQELTNAIRLSAIIEVKKLMILGRKSRAEACDIAGVTVDQYRYWVEQLPADVGEIRQMIFKVEREELAMLVGAKKVLLEELVSQMLQRVINGAFIEDPVAFFSLLESLQERIDQLIAGHQADMGSEQEAQEFLQSGPTQAKGKSMMASRFDKKGDVLKEGTTINVNPRPDGSVDVTIPPPPVEIEEAVFSDSADKHENPPCDKTQ